jgi:hypothetical protein
MQWRAEAVSDEDRARAYLAARAAGNQAEADALQDQLWEQLRTRVRKQERGQRLCWNVRPGGQWSEEEVLERAYDEEHLTSEQLFAYRDDPEAEPLRSVVESHVAGCPYCEDHLEVVCLLPDGPRRDPGPPRAGYLEK